MDTNKNEGKSLINFVLSCYKRLLLDNCDVYNYEQLLNDLIMKVINHPNNKQHINNLKKFLISSMEI